MPAKTWSDVEAAIAEAVKSGLLLDKRDAMPRGVLDGKTREWYKREVGDVLGVAVHQSAGRNTSDPRATGRYHTSVNNHITPGRPLPSLVYHIAITDSGDAWLCGDLSWRTYGQGAKEKDHPGDENKHLLCLLVLGGFHGLGWKPRWAKKGPTDAQLAKLPKVVRWLMDTFDFGGEGVFGHYHFGKAACPGFVVTDWIEECRAKDDKAELATTQETQEALLRWRPGCLPKYGADGVYSSGGETSRALVAFQREHGIRQTGREDPFTELILLQRYPDPELAKGGLVEHVEFTEDEVEPIVVGTGEPSTVSGRVDEDSSVQFDTSDAKSDAPIDKVPTEPDKPKAAKKTTRRRRRRGKTED
jgi:hypothetical protein